MPYFDDLWNAAKDNEQPSMFQETPQARESEVFFTPDSLRSAPPVAEAPVEEPSVLTKVDLSEPETSVGGNIKVLGIGGAGCNAVNRMIEDGVIGVDFVAINTDIQVLKKSLAKYKIAIGTKITKGLGAGAKPDIGEKAAQESVEEIRSLLNGADMVFITAGMGGGTGTGAAPIIAQIAKEVGCLVVAVVTLPFKFEGGKRMDAALNGVDKLRTQVDTSLIISNSRIFDLVDRNTPVTEAFKRIDGVLKQAVQGIASIVAETGLINVDFNDVRTVLANRGEAVMGIGVAKGEGRALKAAQEALSNPLIENSDFRHAGAMVAKIIGGPDFDMKEYDEAAAAINGFCRENAEVVIGLDFDDNLKDQVKIIVVATNLTRESPLDIPKRAENTEMPSKSTTHSAPMLELPIHEVLQGAQFSVAPVEELYLDKDEDWGLTSKEVRTETQQRRIIDFAPRRDILLEDEDLVPRRMATAPAHLGNDLDTPTFLRRKKRILSDNA